DEFAIIFRNSDDIEATAKRMELIIQDIKNTKSIENYIVNVGASAGLAKCNDANISVSEMVEIAYKALYAAIENGKGQVFKSLSA
uniref:diguanylate cyclase domain-containing protein n=1 Tax=Pseudemcibacter sp. TaxID=2943293 RepID=UPI003F69D5DF